MGARKCPGSCGKWFGSRGVPRKPWICPNPDCSAHRPKPTKKQISKVMKILTGGEEVFDISKAYSDDEMERVFLQVQLKEITLCETCDVFFKYVPQKRFCDACNIERSKASVKRHSERVRACPKLRAKEKKRRLAYNRCPEIKAKKREYDQRPDVKERKRRQQRERYWERKAKKNED